MASYTLYPDADGTLTDWTANGSANKWDCIDEGTTSPNDVDYINTTTQSTSGFVRLTDTPSDLGTVTAVTIRMRISTGIKGDYIQWGSVSIVKSDESTAITSSVSMNNGTITTYGYTPASILYTDKTSWDGAKIKFTTGTGTTSYCAVYAAQVELTYTASGGTTTNVAAILSLI